MKSTIDRKYLLNYIAQGNYYIIETKFLFLTPLFLKNIEAKDCCKFVKVSKENLLEHGHKNTELFQTNKASLF